MNYLKLISTLLLAALFAGCDFGKKEDPVVLAADKTSQELVAATTAAQDVAEEMRAFAFDQRAVFTAKMTAKVEALRENVSTLSAKIDGSTAEVKSAAAPKLKALRDQMKVLEKQLVALEGATPSTWDGIKADSLKAYVAVDDGFDDARRWVSEQIAP